MTTAELDRATLTEMNAITQAAMDGKLRGPEARSDYASSHNGCMPSGRAFRPQKRQRRRHERPTERPTERAT